MLTENYVANVIQIKLLMSDNNDSDSENKNKNNSKNQLNMFEKNIMSDSVNMLSLKFISELIQCVLIKTLSITELNISFLKEKLFSEVDNKIITQIIIITNLEMSDEIFKQIFIFIKRKT